MITRAASVQSRRPQSHPAEEARSGIPFPIAPPRSRGARTADDAPRRANHLDRGSARGSGARPARGGLMKTHTHTHQALARPAIGRHDWGFQRRDSLRGASPPPISGNWKPADHRHEQLAFIGSIYLPSGEGLTAFRVRSVCLGREGKAGREKRDGGERPPRCGVLGRLPGGSGGSGDPGW